MVHHSDLIHVLGKPNVCVLQLLDDNLILLHQIGMSQLQLLVGVLHLVELFCKAIDVTLLVSKTTFKLLSSTEVKGQVLN